MSANDHQVGGAHYKVGGEEHWDRVARLQLDYFQGQITKYVERWKNKGGLQDLLKAQHFLEKYIELVRAGTYIPNTPPVLSERKYTPPAPTPEPTEPCYECGDEYPRSDLEAGHIYCPKCRELLHNKKEQP